MIDILQEGCCTSIYRVARRAGVSPSTVSRVVNGHPNVSDRVRHRVLEHARKLAFTPKMRRRAVGLVVADLETLNLGGYVSAMVASIARHLTAQRQPMELVPIENLDLLWNAQVAGVIGITFDERFAKLRSVPNLQLLSVNLPLTQHGIHSVYVDHYAQGFQAAEHLILHGHRRIAFFDYGPQVWGAVERLRGMKDVLRRHAIPCPTDLSFYANQMPAYEALNHVRRLGATAVLNFSDPWILEVPHILQNIFKLRIPQDISIICPDDYLLLRFMTPPHTVIHQPLDELGKAAVDTMLNLLKQPSLAGRNSAKPVDLRLEPKLIARESVAQIGPRLPVPGSKMEGRSH